MSYFFRNAQIRKAFQNERTWDESKVTRGKTGPGTNDGSFAPSGGGGASGDARAQARSYADKVMEDFYYRDDNPTPEQVKAQWQYFYDTKLNDLAGGATQSGDVKALPPSEANAKVTDKYFQAGYDDAGRSPFSRGRDSFDSDQQYRMYMEGWQAKQARSVSSVPVPDKATVETGEGYKQLERSRAYKPPEKIGIGAILRSSWGYGQTNVDYYQVTGMSPSGKTVTLREVAAIDVMQGQKGAGSMSGKKRALPDEFTGKPFQRRIGSNGRVKIKDYASASLWGGTDDYYSWDH